MIYSNSLDVVFLLLLLLLSFLSPFPEYANGTSNIDLVISIPIFYLFTLCFFVMRHDAIVYFVFFVIVLVCCSSSVPLVMLMNTIHFTCVNIPWSLFIFGGVFKKYPSFLYIFSLEHLVQLCFSTLYQKLISPAGNHFSQLIDGCRQVYQMQLLDQIWLSSRQLKGHLGVHLKSW